MTLDLGKVLRPSTWSYRVKVPWLIALISVVALVGDGATQPILDALADAPGPTSDILTDVVQTSARTGAGLPFALGIAAVKVGAKADPHACQIFIVNGAPRTMITVDQAPGTPWTEGWHSVQVVRRVEDGTMEVYFNDMQKPYMTAKDKTFTWGQVGIGTFDDHGNFDEVVLRGKTLVESKKQQSK